MHGTYGHLLAAPLRASVSNLLSPVYRPESLRVEHNTRKSAYPE